MRSFILRLFGSCSTNLSGSVKSIGIARAMNRGGISRFFLCFLLGFSKPVWHISIVSAFICSGLHFHVHCTSRTHVHCTSRTHVRIGNTRGNFHSCPRSRTGYIANHARTGNTCCRDTSNGFTRTARSSSHNTRTRSTRDASTCRFKRFGRNSRKRLARFVALRTYRLGIRFYQRRILHLHQMCRYIFWLLRNRLSRQRRNSCFRGSKASFL